MSRDSRWMNKQMNQRTWTPTTITYKDDYISQLCQVTTLVDALWQKGTLIIADLLTPRHRLFYLLIMTTFPSIVSRDHSGCCVLWRQGGALIVNCADTSYYPGKWMEYHCRSHPELGKHTRINIEARYCYCSCGGALKARKSESYFFPSGEMKIMQI